MRISKLTLLTLTALTVQNLTQQAQADSSEDPTVAPHPMMDDRAAKTETGKVLPVITSPPENLEPSFFTEMTSQKVSQKLDDHQLVTGSDLIEPIEPIQETEQVASREDHPFPLPSTPIPEDLPSNEQPNPAILIAGTSLHQLPTLQPPTRGNLVDMPEQNVKQKVQSLPRLTAGTSERRVAIRQLTTVQVTNRTNSPVMIELVGRVAPMMLRPGQTQRLRINPRDLSLMYWLPNGQGIVTSQLNARVSQPSAQALVVDLLPSRFPQSNLAIYLPDSSRRFDILKVF